MLSLALNRTKHCYHKYIHPNCHDLMIHKIHYVNIILSVANRMFC